MHAQCYAMVGIWMHLDVLTVATCYLQRCFCWVDIPKTQSDKKLPH